MDKKALTVIAVVVGVILLCCCCCSGFFATNKDFQQGFQQGWDSARQDAGYRR